MTAFPPDTVVGSILMQDQLGGVKSGFSGQR